MLRAGAGALSGAAPGTQRFLTGTDGAQAAGASRKEPDQAPMATNTGIPPGMTCTTFRVRRRALKKRGLHPISGPPTAEKYAYVSRSVWVVAVVAEPCGLSQGP